MHSNAEGDYLDADGCPRPLTDAESQPVGDPWERLSSRSRLNVWLSYSTLLAYPIGSLLAWAVWVDAHWLWMPGVTAVMASAFLGQGTLWMVLRSEPDVVQRRLTFAAVSTLLELAATVAVLGGVVILMLQGLGAENGPPLPYVVGALLVVLALDLRAARLGLAWLSRPAASG